MNEGGCLGSFFSYYSGFTAGGKVKKIVYARRLWGPRGFIARDPLNRKRGFDETASRLSNLTPSKNKQLFVYVSTRRVPQTI